MQISVTEDFYKVTIIKIYIGRGDFNKQVFALAAALIFFSLAASIAIAVEIIVLPGESKKTI